jgi:hypothetical protein
MNDHIYLRLRQFKLPEGWVLIPEHTAGPVEKEIALELGPGHVLAGKECLAFARYQDSDDFLVYVNDGTERFASVYLEFSAKPLTSSNFPYTVFYDSLDELGKKYYG